MNWLSRLERKFGGRGIDRLPLYIVIIYAFGTVMNFATGGNFYEMTCFSPALVIQGHQFWRIITFIAAVRMGNSLMDMLFLFFIMMFYYMIGQSLVQVWGSFRFTLYILFGLVGTLLAGFAAYGVSMAVNPALGLTIFLDTYYLVLSMFLAYAAIFPEVTVYLYGLVPLKVKWLAFLDLALLAFDFATGNLSIRICIVISLLNFLIFFLSSRNFRKIRPAEVKRRKDFRKARAGSGNGAGNGPQMVRHRCAVCGRTEKDNPDLEFRYCSKCNGNLEYCNDHLFTHTHVK